MRFPNYYEEEYLLECPGEYEFLGKSNLLNKNNNSLTPFKTSVVIQNGIHSIIYVKLSTNGIGDEAEFPLNPSNMDTWTRYSGMLKILITDNQNLYKYRIKSPGYYKYIGEGLLINGDNSEEIYSNDISIDISDFKSSIHVKNNSSEPIFVRISNIKGFGSEDLFQLERYQEDYWKRFCGACVIEIVELDERSYRFKVFCKGDYTYAGNGVLFDNFSKGNCEIDQSLEINSPSRCEIRIKTDKEKDKNFLIDYNNDFFTIGNITNNTSNQDIFNKYNPYINESLFVKRNLSEKFESFNLDSSTNSELKCLNSNNFMNTYIPDNCITDNLQCEFYNNKSPIFTDKHFVDSFFPPEIRVINSLSENGSPAQFHFYESNKKPTLPTTNICFKRASEIYSSNFDLYSEISPIIPIQGNLGDCYLISVFSSLAQKPDIIKKIFKSKIINPYGFYEIYIYEGTEKRIMFLDDYFPVEKNSRTFVYCKSLENQLWCILLEKALAKYENGYSNIHCGNSKCAFQFFTGANTRWITTLNFDITWKDLLYAAQNKHLIVSGSRGKDHFQKDKYGIHNEHTYSILDAKEYWIKKHNKNDRFVRLMKLRNPWGHANVKTEFSLDSKIWNEDMKEYFGYIDASEKNGIFFISYEIFMECFKDLTICYI